MKQDIQRMIMPGLLTLTTTFSPRKGGNVGIRQDKIIRRIPTLIFPPIQGSWIGIFLDNCAIIVATVTITITITVTVTTGGTIVNIQTASIQVLGRHGAIGKFGNPSFSDTSQEIPFGKGSSSISSIIIIIFGK